VPDGTAVGRADGEIDLGNNGGYTPSSVPVALLSLCHILSLRQQEIDYIHWVEMSEDMGQEVKRPLTGTTHVVGDEILGIYQRHHLLTQQGPSDMYEGHNQVGVDAVKIHLVVVSCAAVEAGLECHPAGPIVPSGGGVVRAIQRMGCSAKWNPGQQANK